MPIHLGQDQRPLLRKCVLGIKKGRPKQQGVDGEAGTPSFS